jgi:hypothetical protein
VHLNESVRAALADGEPVISVDTRKKELVGDFEKAGRPSPCKLFAAGGKRSAESEP